jgi:SAM-dependent methyltransferase
MQEILNAQQEHWEKTFAEKTDMFGASPSEPAKAAVGLFKKEGAKTVLELGCGQGRDTLLFARSGFRVYALDYSEVAIRTIREKAEEAGISDLIQTSRHDIRNPLPFEDGSLDACFSHMLFCMALTMEDLDFLAGDFHYQKGITAGRVCTRWGISSSIFSAAKKWKSWQRASTSSTSWSSKRETFPASFSG